MDLKCYVYPGWAPRIRPASPHRAWMDDAPESFPYRCLPLAIANSHGWEILSPCGFEVKWNGGMAVEDVTVLGDPGTNANDLPVALFGLGTFTIHIQGLFRTPPGWNLLVNGPPNSPKDGVSPLTGIIETDWAPYTFTMNWKLTRPDHTVRFEAEEVIAQIYPVERGIVDAVIPRFLPITDDPELKGAFEAWSRSRDAFQEQMRAHPPEKPADKWQKFYYRGQLPDGRCPVSGHQSKLRVRNFFDAETIDQPSSVAFAAPSDRSFGAIDAQPSVIPSSDGAIGTQPSVLPPSEFAWKIAKYEWLLETLEQQRALSTPASGIYRVQNLTEEEFLDNFYAPGRPVILCGAIADWPALRKWTPAYLRERVGGASIEVQGGRAANTRFELDKETHRRELAFDQFISTIETTPGNDLYLTAYNSANNAAALAPLTADLGTIPAILNHEEGEPAGMLWIGPEGTFTPLHHDLTNNLLVQLVGRKRIILASPAETPKLYNHIHVFSEVGDITNPSIDFNAFPKLKEVRTLEIVLDAGEALFLPIGWWHQVEALDFSVSMTYTNFRWPNEGYREHPSRG